MGIVRVNTPEEWESALDEEFKFADELLVEEFVQGVEITGGDLSGYRSGADWFGEDFHYDITDEEACWALLQKPIRSVEG